MAKTKIVGSLFEQYAENLVMTSTPKVERHPRTEVTLWQLEGRTKGGGKCSLFARPVPKGALKMVQRIAHLYEMHLRDIGQPPLFIEIAEIASVHPVKPKRRRNSQI